MCVLESWQETVFSSNVECLSTLNAYCVTDAAPLQFELHIFSVLIERSRVIGRKYGYYWCFMTVGID